ncbi:retrovirus-related pol polyprotein from transposon TNT 1-94 [Tanacetum coccineum]
MKCTCLPESIGYSQNSKAYIILNKHTRKVKESLNVTFDENPSPYKTSPLVDDDLDEEEAIKVTEKKNLENDTVDETLEVDEIINIKEYRNHPLENVIGNLNQRTLRLVAQGYNQQEGIDYDETYAPVARLESIRILLAYACALDFKLFQMDVKSAFLNGFINEEVYVTQPPGFIDFKKPNHVYKLKKALYGLKQAPKAWYDRLKAFLIKHEYKMGMVDNTLFTKKKSSNLIIVQIYVDDIIFGSTCQDMCDEFAKIMHDEFEMSMMGELNFFLGLQIKQMEDGIFFNQSKYIKEMLKKFGLEDSKPMKTPMSSDTKLTKDEECESVDSTKYRGMIGSLLYLTASRPDIMFSVCLCARFQEAPKTSHLEAVKRIFRYIKGTTHLGLWYPKGTGIETVKQTALAISTTEAEYVSAEKACQQALWMKQALIDYDVRLDDVPIMCDNKGAIDLSKNPVQHSRTKHIEIRHHFLRDNVQKGHISIEKVSSADNIADILTKPLKRESFNYLLSVSPELAFDRYLSHDRAMHPLAPHYERKTRADRGKKRPREPNASSSSSTLNHPSSSHPLNDSTHENDDESSDSNPSSPPQNISSLSNNVSRVPQNPPHESYDLKTFNLKLITLQINNERLHRDD